MGTSEAPEGRQRPARPPHPRLPTGLEEERICSSSCSNGAEVRSLLPFKGLPRCILVCLPAGHTWASREVQGSSASEMRRRRLRAVPVLHS